LSLIFIGGELLTQARKGYARHSAATTELFLNEVALHPAHDIDSLRSPLAVPPENAVTNDYLSKHKDIHFIPAREEAIIACLAAIHECFDSLLAMEIESICALPNLFFVRTGYAARALLKLLNICDSQMEYEGRSHVNVQDLKFEHYMDTMIELLIEVQSRCSTHVAKAFRGVFSQIRNQGIHSSKSLQALRLAKATQQSFMAQGGSPSQKPDMVPGNSFSDTTFPTSSQQFVAPIMDSFTERQTIQPVAINDTSQPLPRPEPLQWQASNMEDTYMTGGLDMIQWFEQDFALDMGVFQAEDFNIPSTGQWRF
jgi:hypothetical protein